MLSGGGMKIQVITDSTSDMPDGLADNYDIKIVPVYLNFGDKTYREGIDITRQELYSMLPSLSIHPTTSQPNPEDFMGVYKKQIDMADGIVSIHISSKLSSTYNSAMTAKKTLEGHYPIPIEVIDSKFNSAGSGLVVAAAAKLAKSGASLAEVVEEANRAIRQVEMFGMFQTMKYMARSGRVNKIIATTSNLLKVMPLLTFHDGEIVKAGLVRTTGKGMDRIYDFVRRNLPISELTIVHSQVIDLADQLKRRLSELIKEEEISIAELGAALGIYGGPGVLLVAVRRANIR